LFFWQTAQIVFLPWNSTAHRALAIPIPVCMVGRFRRAQPLRNPLQCCAQAQWLDFALKLQSNLHRGLHAKGVVPGYPSVYHVFEHSSVLHTRFARAKSRPEAKSAWANQIRTHITLTA
jgi:hypothetical protein